jgi:hypothetical protein
MHQSADFHLLAQAERHVREGEERVARPLAYIRVLEMHRDLSAAQQARRQLMTMQYSLELARDDLAHATRKQQSATTPAKWPSAA